MPAVMSPESSELAGNLYKHTNEINDNVKKVNYKNIPTFNQSGATM